MKEDNENQTEAVDTLLEDRLTASEGVNPLAAFEIPEEQVDALLETIENKEKKILSTLLDEVFTDSLAFNGGIQKFLDVASNQLSLQGIEFNSTRYERIIELLTDVKVLVSFLKLQESSGETAKRLDNLSLELSIKAVTAFLNLNHQEADPAEQQINNLNNLFISFLKDFSSEVAKNSDSVRAQNSSFLRELKSLLTKKI
jgi:hypothetical protein